MHINIAGIATLAIALAASPATLNTTLAAAPTPVEPTSVFDLTGFAAGTVGGGVINETDPAYRKVYTALEFITAIRDANSTPKGVTTPKVIEIMNDLNLGWNEIGAEAQGLSSNPARTHALPKIHPVLKTTGVTLLDIKPKAGGLTIFSANGATIKHVTFNIKSTNDIIIRNLKFDEMWEWDESTKGDYDSNDWDFITLGNGGAATKIWIDHCTFTKSYDGITDMKAKASGVTYSWCRITGAEAPADPDSFVGQQLQYLEDNKASNTFYRTLRDTAGFTKDQIATIIQGQKKGILMGANDLKAENAALTATFHHLLMENLWDRAIPRLRGGNVHVYNAILDDTGALAAKRLRDSVINALPAASQTAVNKFKFQPPLNGCISTEDGAILLEKSVYIDCLTPLRNNQTDVNNPAYTGKILGLDVIYKMDGVEIRGNSTDTGNPLGPKQAPVKEFAWGDAIGGQLPYAVGDMDDPSLLEDILRTSAGAGAITWNDGDKTNWLKTTYPAAPSTPVAPVIVVQPKTQSVIDGATITLTVAASGSPVLHYQWYKDATIAVGADSGTLTLANISAADAGSYHCVVSNNIAPDATSAAAVISLAPAPAPPVAADATAITATGFTANWAASDNATGYSIDISPDPAFATFWPGCENLDAGNVTGKTITGLNGATTYYYRVRATVGSYATASSNVITAATANVALNALVNDAMNDTDRNSDVANPTATNTQWVTNSGGTFAPSATGLKWTLTGTSNAMCLGYFPLVSVGVGDANSVTLTLNFTTGADGSTVGNLRTALINDTDGGRITADGFGSTNNAYIGDVGYGVFSASGNVGAGNTTNLVLRTYKRSATTNNNLLGSTNDWGNAAGSAGQMGNSSGATGYLAANTAYTLAITLSYDGTALSIRTQLTGGNMSGMDYTVTDDTTPILDFNALAIRPEKAAGQFSFLNITSLQITQGAGVPIPAVPAIYGAATAGGSHGTPLTLTLAATNAPTSFIATGLPAGLVCSAAGVISGTPAEYGVFDVTITPSNAAGDGAPFALELTIAAPPPPAPAAATASTPTAHGFTASWSAVTDATGYEIDVATDPAFTSPVDGYDGFDVGNVTTFTLTDLEPATTYYYRVRALIGEVEGASATSAPITTTTDGGGGSGGYLVNDTFADTDRIGGTDGSAPVRNGPPFTSAPTADNTQWVISNTNTKLIATAAGMTWNFNTADSSVIIMGYYPDFTLQSSSTTTVALTFTIGGAPADVALSNIRFALVDDKSTAIPAERLACDLTSASNDAYKNDTGYAFISKGSTIGAGNTANVVFETGKRNATGIATNSLLTNGIGNHWDSLGDSAGETGYFEADTTYTMTFKLAYDGTALAITTHIDGGKFSEAGNDYTYTVTDPADPNLTFNTIAVRVAGTKMFDSINFTALKIWEGDEPSTTPPPPPPALSAATGVTAGGFSVNWAASAGATGYFLDISTDPAFGSFVAGYDNLDIGNATSHTITGLAPGTTYYYRVRATGTGGASVSSASGSVATTAAAKPAFFVKFTTTRASDNTSPATAGTITIAAPGGGWNYSAAAPVAGDTWNFIKRPLAGIPSGTNLAGYATGLAAYTPAQNTRLTDSTGGPTDITLSAWIDIQDPEDGRSEPSNYDNGVAAPANLGPDDLMKNALRIYRPGNTGMFTFAGLPADTCYLVYVYSSNGVADGQGCKFTLAPANVPVSGDSWIEVPGTAASQVFQTDGVSITPIAPAKTATASNDAAAVGSSWGRILAVTGATGELTLTTARNTPNKAQAINGIQLVPYPAPTITLQPDPAPIVTLNDSITISVTAAGFDATDILVYQWRKNGADIDTVDNPSAATATFTIASAQYSDADTYDVVVSNLGGDVTSDPAILTVTATAIAPSVTTPPAARTATTGGSVTFTAIANGTSPLSYVWQKSVTSATDDASFTDVTAASATSAFTIGNITTADAGYYRVKVTNSVETACSSAATLIVAPVLVTPPAPAVVSAGSHTITVIADTGIAAAPFAPVSCVWKRNGVTITDGAGITGATTASLAITSFTAASSGAYTVTVTNAAGSVTSAPVYIGVATAQTATLFPAPGATDVNPDTPPSITLTSVPVAGSVGTVRIYDAADDTLVDTIDLSALSTLNAAAPSGVVYRYTPRNIGEQAGNNNRPLNSFPIVVTGSTARVTLAPVTTASTAAPKLAYGKTYYVQIDPGVILDATGATYPGISDKTTWRFSTKAAAPDSAATALTVAADGSGDFTTLQGAIDLIPLGNTTRRTITVKNGVYTELIRIPYTKNNITIQGESRAGVVIEYLNNNTLLNGAHMYGRTVFFTEGGNTIIQNLTIRNLTPKGGGQAEALTISSNAANTIVNRCDITSLQDTLYLGKQTFLIDNYVEGDVDFTWSENGPAYFLRNELKAMNTQSYYNWVRGGASETGFVYVDCMLTRAATVPDASCYLGRTQDTKKDSMALYIDTFMDAHIKPEGWLSALADNTTLRFWEYNSMNLDGTPAVITSRPTYNAIATGAPAAAAVLPNQQVDQITADYYRDPANVVGFTPAIAPVLDTQPAAQDVAPGATATFTIGYTAGYPAATVKWYKGAALVGSAPVLTIANAQYSDAGDYHAVISNDSDTLTTAVVTLTVAIPAAPNAPTLAAPGSVTAGGFTACWNAVAGATGYFLDVSTDPAFGSFVAGYDNLDIGNATSHAITGLAADTTYYYRVRATGPGGTSVSSTASAPVTTATGGGGSGGYLVNDTFTDTDRIGGFDGSATAPDTPVVSVPTDTNTQWVATSTSTLVATGTGMVWNYVGTGNSMTIGYFPDVTVAASSTVTVQLKFTTGVVGTGANNLRIALFNDTANGRFPTDSVTASSPYYEGDIGYAIMSASSNIGNSDANLVLRTYKRINATATDLLGSAGNWGTAVGTTSQIGNSTGATGYLQGENDYTLTVTLAKNAAGTEMTIGAKLEGGNFSGLEYSVVDQDTTAASASTFNALAFRLGGSTTQYDHIKFTGLKIWEGEEPAASAPVINSPSTATAAVGAPFTYTITASDSPTSYALAGGALPAGLTLDSATGIIGGTPAESGVFTLTLTATNDIGTSAPATLTLTVNPAVSVVPVITSATTATATVGTAFAYTITADNGPITGFDATGLPASLTLNTATGVISGAAGTGDVGPHLVALTATNAIGPSLPATLTLTVELPPALVAPVASPATGVTTTGFIAQWDAVANATGYYLDVATDPAFTSFVPTCNNLDTGAARLRAITGLAPDTDYYYRVRAYDVSGPTASSNTITTRTADTETILVDDRLADTDRIGGADGSATTSSSPTISAPTDTNTQWVASRVRQLVASPAGLKWNLDTTSSVGAQGYFPEFSVNNGQTVTLRLDFTTGTLGPAANNLRIALLNGAANGRRATDGFNPGGTGDATFVGDTGYGFFTNSNVGGNAASPVTLNVNKRLATSNAALLNTTADWGTPPNSTENMGTSGTPPGDHLFAANTAYTLILTLTRESATSLALTAQITGGTLTRLICTGVDTTDPVTTFDTISFRLGQGSNQFSDITFTALTITTTGSGIATEPPVITSALTASALLGTPFTHTIAATNMPTGFTAAGLPAGLTLNTATGVISGTPAITGSFAVTITATNAIGSDIAQLDLRVTAGESTIDTIVPPGGGLDSPTATASDAAGNAYVADVATGTIKKIAPDGAVTTFATVPQIAVLAIAPSGDIYAACDDGSVLKITSAGAVTTPALATGVTTPGGIAIAADGSIYVSKTAANTIIKITPAGATGTLAGSGAAGNADATGAAATFNGPTGLAINNATGALYVADTVNCTLREINLATGAVTTVAGRAGVPGDTGSAGSDGKATDATLNAPEALAIDSAGLLYIADTGNNLIRGFDPVSGALVTLAGDTGATTLDAPAGLAFDPVTGIVRVADTGNNALRAVTLAPVIAAKIADRAVPLGSTVTLDGTAWASPAATYLWTVHGSTPLDATATITINVNTVTDSGVYTITATNDAGSGSASMRLTVSGNDTTPGPNADSPGTGGSGGGGGAPGFWFLGALVLLACIQKLTTRRRNSSNHRHRAALLAVTLSLFTLHAAPFSAPLKAQQTAASANTANADADDDLDDPGEVITMSAFEVRSESVKGYQASESVTGTRVASLLRELPFNVNVVTSEFIADFNALELSDQLANVSSFSPSENIGQYQLRGYQASTQLVDGFRRVGLTGVTVTDRVEVIKGPAASIYGAIQPGGAVNTLRKKPAATPKYGLTAGFGDNGQARASFYATGPVGNGKKLFYRVDTEYRTARRQQDFAKTRNEYAAVQLLYKPTSRTTIGLFIDHADRHDYNTYQMVTAAVNLDTTNAPSWLPYSLDTYQRYYAKTYTQYFGMDYDYYNFNLLGPNANRHNRLTAGSLTLDHKFSNAWSLRASLNTSYNPTHGEKASATYYPFGESSVSADTATPPPASVKLTPQHDEGMTKATGFQLDNLFRFATGPVRHQFLVTTDYYRNSDQATSLKWPASMYYDPLDPWSTHGAYTSFDYPTWEEDPSNYTVYSTNAKTISRDYGLFLSERATMFNGRLIAMIGGRYDYVDSTAEHKPTEDDPTAKKANYNVDAWTYQAGLTAILTRHIALYANASTAFDPQPQLDENDDPLPNIESKGYEFGVKLTLLQERLNITLNRFDIRQKNLVTSVTDAITQEKEVILTGEQVAKGYEIDFNWQLTRSLNIVGGYGLVDAKITDAGKLNWMNDTTPRRVPKHNLGASIRYEFVTGKLKGLFAIAGVTYYSKSLVNLGSGKSLVPYTGAPTVSGLQGNQIHNLRFPNGGLPYPYLPENAIITYYDSATKYLYWTDNPAAATTADLTKYSYADPYMSGISYVLDGREQNYNRASTVWKAGIGYKFRSGSRKTRTSHKIQINMDNIFNEKSTLAGGIPILKRTLMATYSVTF